MNLQPRMSSLEGSKEILADVVGLTTQTVTLDATKFTAGTMLKSGMALVVNATTKKAEPFDALVAGEAVLLFRDVRTETKDVISLGLVGGYVKEAACTGVTDDFKNKAKMIYFK